MKPKSRRHPLNTTDMADVLRVPSPVRSYGDLCNMLLLRNMVLLYDMVNFYYRNKCLCDYYIISYYMLNYYCRNKRLCVLFMFWMWFLCCAIIRRWFADFSTYTAGLSPSETVLTIFFGLTLQTIYRDFRFSFLR